MAATDPKFQRGDKAAAIIAAALALPGVVAHADAAPAIHVHTFVIRAAMANLVAHGLHE